MQIVSAVGGPFATNGYLLADEQSGDAVIIDAPYEATVELLDEARGRNLRVGRLLLTHGHIDHIAEHKLVTDACGAQVGIHPDDAFMLMMDQARMFGLPPIPQRQPDFLIAPGMDLRVGSLRLEVLHVPGHSPGSVCFHVFPEGSEGDTARQVLFGGDLIFQGSVGRTDLPGGSYPTLLASLRRVMKLPDGLVILPGHGDPTTIGDERAENPFVAEALQG